MSRVFPFPRLTDGVTICHLSDQHFGQRDEFHPEWMATAGRDFDDLKSSCVGYVITGDCDHWRSAKVDGPIGAWLDARETNTGHPISVMAGNHDLSSFIAPYPGRSAVQWGSDIGGRAPNSVIDMGEIRIIGTSPEYWQYTVTGNYGRMVMTQTTIDWIDAQLKAAGNRDVFLANHAPIPEHYPGHMETATAQAFTALIDAYPNVKGFLSGHRHANIQTEPDHFKVVTVGSRKIFGVNAPACGGSLPGTLPDRDIHNWGTPMESMFLTYTGDTLTTRWRDHQRARWQLAAGDLTRTISLTA